MIIGVPKANIPGAVARTSTMALSNVTITHALQIVNKGYERACSENLAQVKGLNGIAEKLRMRQ